MTSKMAEILLEEMENKKNFVASYDLTCSVDECVIEEGDRFVFMGDKRKVSLDCLGKLQAELEDICHH